MDYVIAVGGKAGPYASNIVQIYHVQEDTWTVRNNFTYAMIYGIGYVLDQSRFFVHGGIAAPVGDIEKSIFEYDFDNDAWIQTFELHRIYAAGFAIVYNA